MLGIRSASKVTAVQTPGIRSASRCTCRKHLPRPTRLWRPCSGSLQPAAPPPPPPQGAVALRRRALQKASPGLWRCLSSVFVAVRGRTPCTDWTPCRRFSWPRLFGGSLVGQWAWPMCSVVPTWASCWRPSSLLPQSSLSPAAVELLQGRQSEMARNGRGASGFVASDPRCALSIGWSAARIAAGTSTCLRCSGRWIVWWRATPRCGPGTTPSSQCSTRPMPLHRCGSCVAQATEAVRDPVGRERLWAGSPPARFSGLGPGARSSERRRRRPRPPSSCRPWATSRSASARRARTSRPFGSAACCSERSQETCSTSAPSPFLRTPGTSRRQTLVRWPSRGRPSR
mmetsp:Transcript_116746/g.371503  ORF Transcript_116746/g.371503 Transcript_116746/m.371503 type:complete len:343 (+) Transcript_116746:2845-3873(+)